MKKLLSILAIGFALSLGAQNNTNMTDKKYVEVTGVAEMEVIPNEIYLSISLQEEKEGLKRSVEQQENILIEKLNKLNVELKNLKLSNVNSYTYWDKKNMQSYKQKTFELKLEEAARASEVMYELKGLEIYNMYVARTDHSEIQKFKKQVKIDAVIAAKEKATYLLEAVNEEVGEVLFIVEQENNYYGGAYGMNSFANVRGSAEEYQANEDVEFKPIILKYNILARFEIK